MPIELPKNPAPYITDWLMEIGPISSTGMGPVPVSWGDIKNWQELTGNDLDPWEARTIRQLSKDFLAQMNEAKSPNCAPPYSTGPNDEAVSNQFANMMAAMKARQDNGKRKQAR